MVIYQSYNYCYDITIGIILDISILYLMVVKKRQLNFTWVILLYNIFMWETQYGINLPSGDGEKHEKGDDLGMEVRMTWGVGKAFFLILFSADDFRTLSLFFWQESQQGVSTNQSIAKNQ